jgi:hypothetical protein
LAQITPQIVPNPSAGRELVFDTRLTPGGRAISQRKLLWINNLRLLNPAVFNGVVRCRYDYEIL